MIPKIIHYCWLSNDSIPDRIQKCIDSWHKYLPDYEIILWDTKRFNINDKIWTHQAYNAKKYAFVADYIRLYAVYNYGGIYLDSDVEVIKSFDPLLGLHSFICWQKDIGGLEMAVFGAEKGTKWLEACLSYYSNRQFINDDNTYNILPMPEIAEQYIKKSNFLFQTVYSIDTAKLVTDQNIVPVFSSDFFSPKSYLTGEINIENNTFAIHHFAGSWLSKKDRYILHLRQNRLKIFPFKIRYYISKFIGTCKYDGCFNAIKECILWSSKVIFHKI